jgi:hypothetical protein
MRHVLLLMALLLLSCCWLRPLCRSRNVVSLSVVYGRCGFHVDCRYQRFIRFQSPPVSLEVGVQEGFEVLSGLYCPSLTVSFSYVVVS